MCAQIIIGKEKGLYTVKFEIEDEVMALLPHGHIDILFEGLEVQDIRPKLRKFLGRKLPHIEGLGSLRHGPAYYAERFAKGKRIHD
jgi:hypothetical protein